MSPGPNMAFVLAHGASYGWRGGVAAALGISAADLVLTALTAAGVTAAIAQWPPSFDLIRWAGVFYLLWMAWKALRVRATGPLHTALQASLMSVFMRAMLNSLLNPKALLFFMVFLPQFVVPGSSSVARQIVTLGLVLTLIATFFHIALGRWEASSGGTRPAKVNLPNGSRGALPASWCCLRFAWCSRRGPLEWRVGQASARDRPCR